MGTFYQEFIQKQIKLAKDAVEKLKHVRASLSIRQGIKEHEEKEVYR